MKKKKKESNGHLLKRLVGCLECRKQTTYKLTLKDLMSYKNYQEKIMKAEGCWGWWKGLDVETK